jgi:ABC-type transporter Mla MlaB component
MAEPKDSPSFFRKMVKFVANPATEWAEITSRHDVARETETAKSELKSMIERKRRNDFVRKRELDMLRQVRREGLTGDQLAALGGNSRNDDSEVRASDSAKVDNGVKAKIDQIEQQMVGDGYSGSTRRSNEFQNAPARPAPMSGRAPEGTGAKLPARVGTPGPVAPRPGPDRSPAAAPGRPALGPAATALNFDLAPAAMAKPFAVEVSDVAHDPDLDEAVIAFANADFEQCENALSALVKGDGARNQHAETWLVLFDLYRATGQQNKFESLALDYAQQFGWSSPQWFSMPKQVADASVDAPLNSQRIAGQIGWICPPTVDADVVAKLSSQTLQMPLPWVFDWGGLQNIDAEACARLSELFRKWITQKLEMHWLSGERLFTVLQDASPTGVRDVDPAFWRLRLDALRMTNRPDQFDEAAIDYCVTYEVSPPSWERAVCLATVSGSKLTATQPAMSVVGEVSTSFVESRTMDDPVSVQVTTVELSGQLVGDIAPTLKKMDEEIQSAAVVNVSCANLIRVDFIAAGDLLNWVLTRRTESRSVSFLDAHRLVALFFGAMGINEHAKVKVRTI